MRGEENDEDDKMLEVKMKNLALQEELQEDFTPANTQSAKGKCVTVMPCLGAM